MRRGPSLKRKPEPDPLFNSVLVSQLTNQILLDGRKDTARNIVYSALELVEKQVGGDPLAVLKEAFENEKKQIFITEQKSCHYIPYHLDILASSGLDAKKVIKNGLKNLEN